MLRILYVLKAGKKVQYTESAAHKTESSCGEDELRWVDTDWNGKREVINVHLNEGDFMKRSKGHIGFMLLWTGGRVTGMWLSERKAKAMMKRLK